MSSEIATMNLADTVTDRVRKVILDSLPEDAIKGLIDKEFKRFFEADTSSYNPRPSGFTSMVQQTLKKLLEEAVSDHIKAQVTTYVQNWEGGNRKIVDDLVEELAPAAMRGIMQEVAGRCINSLMQRS